MRKLRWSLLVAQVVSLAMFTSCTKEEVDMSVTNNYGGSGSGSYTLTATPGPGAPLDVDEDNLGWTAAESVIELSLADNPLEPGDSVIVIAQVGLQMNGFCIDNMHLRSSIIQGVEADTPAAGDEVIDENWSGEDLYRQFLRTRTMVIGSQIPTKVKVYMKPYSGECGANSNTQCFLLNRSLTVIVIPHQ